jgi:hypothetical protein
LFNYGSVIGGIPHVPAKCTHNHIIALASRHATQPLVVRNEPIVDQFVEFVKNDLVTNPLFRPFDYDINDTEIPYKYIQNSKFDSGKKKTYLNHLEKIKLKGASDQSVSAFLKTECMMKYTVPRMI